MPCYKRWSFGKWDVELFMLELKISLKRHLKNYDTFSFDDDWCDEIENGAYIITQTVSDHGYNLLRKFQSSKLNTMLQCLA